MYKIHDQFILQELDNTFVLFHCEKELLYDFNDTASFILKQLQNGSPNETILKEFVSRYEIGPEQAQEDIEHFIKELLKIGIIYED